MRNELMTGWLNDISDDIYNNIDALRASDLKEFCKSAAHYMTAVTTTRPQTEAMRWGSIVHLALLQPEEFERRVVIELPCDKRTTAGKAQYAEFKASLALDSIVITHDERMILLDMRYSYAQYTTYKEGFAEAVFERAGMAELFGVSCKIKPDIFLTDSNKIYDLKTTEDASEQAFTRTIFSYQYHIQAAFYALVAEEITGFPVEFFSFIAIEKKAPYAVREFVLSKSTLDYAKVIVRRKLSLFHSCKLMDLWDGYSKTPVSVEIPRWFVDIDL